MKIYVEEKISVARMKYQFPSVLLIRNDWDDFSYKSLFSAYYQNESSRDSIGEVKILHKGRKTPMLKHFSKHLPAGTCSLGVNLNYYSQAKRILGNEYLDYLDVMNDVTFLPGLHEEFKLEEGFRKSLLRDMDAKKVLERADLIHFGEEADKRDFEFEVNLKGATKPHKMSFLFQLDEAIPGRLIALIGKNGTGKTQFISNLAKALGKETRQWNPKTQFPHFNRILAISFSPFDDLTIPERTKRFNYFYCGIRDPKSNKPLTKHRLLTLLKVAGVEILNEYK